MLCLTNAGIDRDATQFMTMDDTLVYDLAGYRSRTSKRVGNVQLFAEQYDLPNHPFDRNAKPGDVMLFFNNTLHKGAPPKRECRDVFVYLLLPNLCPWDRQLERDGIGCRGVQFGRLYTHTLASASCLSRV